METGEYVLENLSCPTKPVSKEEHKICAETDSSDFGLKMVVNRPKYILKSNECWASFEDMKNHMIKQVSTPGWKGWEISHFNKIRSKFSGDGGYGTVYGPKYDCSNLGRKVGNECQMINDVAYRLNDTVNNEKKTSFVVFLK